jgi:hypothetical protein
MKLLQDELDQPILGKNLPEFRYGLPKQREHNISHRDFYVLSLHLSGVKAEDIAPLAGLASKESVYYILRKDTVLLARQQLLEGLELEFETLQKDIFQTVKDKLNSLDENIQLKAIEIWMKYFKKYTPKENTEEKLTAEDLVKKFLNINLQVNVNNAKQ